MRGLKASHPEISLRNSAHTQKTTVAGEAPTRAVSLRTFFVIIGLAACALSVLAPQVPPSPSSPSSTPPVFTDGVPGGTMTGGGGSCLFGLCVLAFAANPEIVGVEPTTGTDPGALDQLLDAPAVEAEKRTFGRPTPEMQERLVATATEAGVTLDLEALQLVRDGSAQGDDQPQDPVGDDTDTEGRPGPIKNGVQHKPPVSDQVDGGSYAVFYKTVANGGSAAPSQLYTAFKEDKPAALEMAEELVGKLGASLLKRFPQLQHAQVVPIMGHDAARASSDIRTHALSKALGFGTVNVDIVTHMPRGAVKEYTNAKERTELLHNKYTADVTSLPPRSDDGVPLDIVLVDDSSSYGCTSNEIARTIRASARSTNRPVKVWVVVLAHGVGGDDVSNSHLSDEVHRQIADAVDDSSAEQLQAKPAAGRYRAAVYIKFGTEDSADGSSPQVVGAYGGSTVRHSYMGKEYETIVGTRDREHERQLEKGTHHAYRVQRLKRKEGHSVSLALLFNAIESDEGEGWETFVRRVIALEQELLDALNWYRIMLNSSTLAGRPSEASCRRGGRHSQQNVQLVWHLAAGGSVLSPTIGRLAKLQGNVQPAIAATGEPREDGTVRLSFACDSTPIDVTPPAGWDGREPTVQRASVEAGRHTQQNVQLVWRLRNGGSLLSTTMVRLANLQGDKDPAIAGTGEMQEDGRVRLTFACGSEPIDVTPPTGWGRQRPTVQRATVEAQHVNLHGSLAIAGSWYIPDAPAMLAMRAQLTLPAGSLDDAETRSRLAALTAAATSRVKGSAVSEPTDKGTRHAA